MEILHEGQCSFPNSITDEGRSCLYWLMEVAHGKALDNLEKQLDSGGNVFTPVTFSSTWTIIPIHSACVSLNKRLIYIYCQYWDISFISTILRWFSYLAFSVSLSSSLFFLLNVLFHVQEPKHILIPVRLHSLHTVWVFCCCWFFFGSAKWLSGS